LGPFDTASVLAAYIAAGVPPSKLNLGLYVLPLPFLPYLSCFPTNTSPRPLYGRAFTNTAGLGLPYDGIGLGSFEPGVYDYKDLPLAGAVEHYDAETGATYSYHDGSGMLVSYDTVDMALKKVDYVRKMGLGGAMWWEISGDKAGAESIVSNVSVEGRRRGSKSCANE
jgi:chitinase